MLNRQCFSMATAIGSYPNRSVWGGDTPAQGKFPPFGQSSRNRAYTEYV